MDSLGITAVIATILSMIFAAAAMWNSIARRRHEARMAELQEPETEKLKFRPAPSSPAVSTHPNNTSRHSHPHAPPKPSPPAAEPGPPSLFRQIRPTGEVEDEQYPEDEDMYVWE
ncbi:MAG: hypothetical protein JJU05_09665 [Verrucomicrobia bacterium]|nr:hypothetical protein [Verrucomicrobiota bacterium]MCH8525982.1 hypothetical protein [Kiritimatiellia bacterium]